jgi:RNA polymerase sigma-70 factor (ECF subfamily)
MRRATQVIDLDVDEGFDAAAIFIDDGWIQDTYHAHAADLRRYAIARLRDPIAAEDIVQESFLRLAREARSQRYPEQPQAWLYRVARNLIISGARRAMVAKRRAADDVSTHANAESPEIEVLALELQRSLSIAMNVIGADGRNGLIMAAQGYSGREIAIALGRSEEATRTLMCRARRAVRHELASLEGEHISR